MYGEKTQMTGEVITLPLMKKKKTESGGLAG
jgi:hypothetical protein